MLKGTNQEVGRPHNRRIVLETIRQHGPLPRVEIARRIGLTTQTVSTITSELHERGFVALRPGVPKGRGFPAPSLEINPDGGYACGVYVTPRGLEAGLINLSGKVLARKAVSAPQMSADTAFAHIGAMVREMVADCPRERFIGAGMAMPGPFDIESMSFVGPTTMEGWRGVDVGDRLQKAVGYPAFVEVDSAAAAHCERLYGVGEELFNFYYLYMGVGLGGCVIYDGQVIRGAWGNAGEIGHVPLVPDGDPCPCGNHGCLERYLSLEAYARRTPVIGEAGWLEETAPLLRSAIVTIENLFDPETIVLGGLAPVELRLKLLALTADLPNSLAARQDRQHPRVILSRCGTDAVLRGAASLAITQVFSPRLPAPPRAAGDLFAKAGRARIE
ncbi:ROK family transcriptional regulator [Chelativorans xinjiangense]|uniref:ROK family transcriptional regulator n=1 Tax=Chelativorans xinjiangense TaxID=2681485 RepID=UPI001FE9F92A|nr:ROK family transcriptional regulator [Chelativorans xinjiangense]